LAAPFFVIIIAMVLACVVICLTAMAATIEGDNREVPTPDRPVMSVFKPLCLKSVLS
jgi:hypothetical protein